MCRQSGFSVVQQFGKFGKPAIPSMECRRPPDWFNPDIANAFFRAGIIEAWGRGIERSF